MSSVRLVTQVGANPSYSGEGAGDGPRHEALIRALDIALADDTVFIKRMGYVVPNTCHPVPPSRKKVCQLKAAGSLAGISLVASQRQPGELCPLFLLFMLRGPEGFLDDEKMFRMISLETELATSGLAAWRKADFTQPVPSEGTLAALLELVFDTDVGDFVNSRLTRCS